MIRATECAAIDTEAKPALITVSTSGERNVAPSPNSRLAPFEMEPVNLLASLLALFLDTVNASVWESMPISNSLVAERLLPIIWPFKLCRPTLVKPGVHEDCE